jgi:dTDP-L-rhamnose 4-epimerase
MPAARERVLVTGGAGFIGSHLTDRLLERGYEVRILDSLVPQVHERTPPYLNPLSELRQGDVRDPEVVRHALEGVDSVVHFAAAVGVGQSMYEVSEYCSANVMGTANLLEILVKDKRRPRRVLVASSMSIYGEGSYDCAQCGRQEPPPRPAQQLADRDWSMRCPRCRGEMAPAPTAEGKRLRPTSVYAINKRDQEEMVLAVCRGIGVPAVALRFFNVYGHRQSLSNPYTGVAAIFSSALLNGRAPLVFEDGHQLRDFIDVRDIVSACMLALETEGIVDEVFNVGTGVASSVLDLFEALRQELSSGSIRPEVMGTYREGDIRACYADITRARTRLGFTPQILMKDGLRDLARWVAAQTSVDSSREALAALKQHRLVR